MVGDNNKQMMMNFTVQTADEKSRMNNLLQNNRVGGRGVAQGRNIQALHGAAADGSMKVSETRDSSFQMLPSTGMGGGGGSTFLNLQTTYNANANDFDDVSDDDCQ